MIKIDSREIEETEIRGSIQEVSAEISFALRCLGEKMVEEKIVSDFETSKVYLHLLVDHLQGDTIEDDSKY